MGPLETTFLGVVLVAFAGAVWKIVLWGRDNVATPVINSHLSLVNALTEATPKQTVAMESHAASLQILANASGEYLTLQGDTSKLLAEIKREAERQTAILSKLACLKSS